MAFKVGSGSALQAAKQTTWGTPVTPTVLLNMTGESISTSYQKGDEGNLLALKTAGQQDLLAVVVEGGVNSDNIGDLESIIKQTEQRIVKNIMDSINN